MARVAFQIWLSNTKRELELEGMRLVRVILPETMEGTITNEIAAKANVRVRKKRGKLSGGLQLVLDDVHIVFDHRVHPVKGQGCLLYMEAV